MNNKLIRKLFFAELLAQSVAIYTVSTIMFGDRGGLSSSQIGIVLGAFSITTLLFEIPTGVLADRFSRKWTMVVARLILSAGMLMWFLVPNFKGYIAGIICMGIAESMMSGALQAYLYESLGEDTHKFNRYNSRLWAVMMTGWMIGSGIAALVGLKYGVLLVVSALLPLVSAGITATLPKEPRPTAKDTKVATLITGAAKYIVSTRKLLYAFFAIISLKILVDVLIEYIPLYYKAAGSPVRLIPFIFLVGNFITIFLFWHSHTLVKFLKRKEALVGLLFLLLFIVSRYIGTVPAIMGIFLYVRYVRIMFVDLESEFQHLSVNKYRATLGSLYSMVSRIGAAISFVAIGYFSQKSSLLTPILVLTVVFYSLYRLFYALAQKHDTASKIG